MIAITGAAGQLGLALAEACQERGIACAALTRRELDITNAQAVAAWFAAHPCECIINCAAYTAVDKAEDEPLAAYAANALAPWLLARTKLPVVHVSTDYVFDGAARTPYETDAPARPASVYGLTKRAGETALLENAGPGLIVRTAWVYSPRAGTKNFFNPMRRLFSSRESVSVVNDQRGAPTLAEDLAQTLLSLYEKGLHREPMQVLHMTNAGEATWFEFAKAIQEGMHSACRVLPISSAEYPTRAQRPAYSVLSLEKLKSFGITPRHWQAALASALEAAARRENRGSV